MSEEQKFETEEKDDEVEAHRRRLTEEPSEQEETGDDGDDVEAHRRRS